MRVSHDVQDIIADVSAAIAGSKTWGRVEQEKLRRSLKAIATSAGEAERAAGTERLALGELVAGVRGGVADLTGLAAHLTGFVDRADAVVQAGAAR